MSLVDQWRALEETLPAGWETARLRLIVNDRSRVERAAALLGPANPGRYGRAQPVQGSKNCTSGLVEIVEAVRTV